MERPKATVTQFALLEAFIDEGITKGRIAGYIPSEFIAMRVRYQTVPAIERLLKAGAVQSGFRRLQSLGLLDWSIEAAVQKFPDQFSREAQEAAAFRLDNINDPSLRG